MQLDNCSDVAAQVSFYFVLSIFPFFLVLAALIGSIPDTGHWDSFAEWVSADFPYASRRLILSTVLALSRGYGRFLSLGIVATLWSASTGFMSLMNALSIAYNARDSRSYLRKRLIAMCATLLVAIFILASFGLWNLGHLVATFIATDLHFAVLFETQWKVIRWFATLLLICLGIDLIHYFLPAANRPWRWLSPGTIFVALAFVAATFLFNLYIMHGSNIPKVYGTLAGFIVLMLWIYIANLILLIGAETDTAIRELKNRGAVA